MAFFTTHINRLCKNSCNNYKQGLCALQIISRLQLRLKLRLSDLPSYDIAVIVI